LVGSLDSSCRYKRFLSCLGCASQRSTKYYFPHYTLFPFISPHHSATWAGSRAGSPVSVSLVSSIELTDGGGGGRVGGRSQITRPQKSLALYKIIQYSLDTRVMTRGSHALSICIAAWVRRPGKKRHCVNTSVSCASVALSLFCILDWVIPSVSLLLYCTTCLVEHTGGV
jgi:hypothetical protein